MAAEVILQVSIAIDPHSLAALCALSGNAADQHRAPKVLLTVSGTIGESNAAARLMPRKTACLL